jgi:hypothetical protein
MRSVELVSRRQEAELVKAIINLWDVQDIRAIPAIHAALMELWPDEGPSVEQVASRVVRLRQAGVLLNY